VISHCNLSLEGTNEKHGRKGGDIASSEKARSRKEYCTVEAKSNNREKKRAVRREKRRITTGSASSKADAVFYASIAAIRARI
jgi:hypothetical protein